MIVLFDDLAFLAFTCKKAAFQEVQTFFFIMTSLLHQRLLPVHSIPFLLPRNRVGPYFPGSLEVTWLGAAM